MQETGRYKLKKPDPSDYADIGALNGNADAIDGALAGLEDAKADKTLVNVTNEDFKAKADAAGAGGVPPEMAARLVYSGPAVPGTPIVIPQDADTLEHKTLAQILTDTALTGSPTAPTPAQGDSSALIATTAFVSAAIIRLIGSAPGALDTLEELAAALGNDANFATTVTNLIAGKAAQADLTAHIADAVKHITAAERAAWNNVPKSGSYVGTQTGSGSESYTFRLNIGFKPSLLTITCLTAGYSPQEWRIDGATGRVFCARYSTASIGIENYDAQIDSRGVTFTSSNPNHIPDLLDRKYVYIAFK
ncbi:hypothetical protein [Intestinibacillus massiliensis]|uniref:hypothetical protein n=1 Tax=Intestinibacillus massiliensis TaxID=1871029 RepID=UPI00190EA5B8|nr:hypothetical protein [Intestinibacillus massiliensis]